MAAWAQIAIEKEPDACGLNEERRRNILNFAFSGEGNVATDISKYPWTASILKYLGNFRGPRYAIHCVGSLISLRHILTASHCMDDIQNMSELLVVLGANNPLVDDGTEFNIKDVVKHPKFSRPFAYYDIAIMELEKPLIEFKFDYFPICLPKLPEIDVNKYKDKTARISGYGSKDKRNSELHFAPLNVLDHKECSEKHYKDLEGNSQELSDLRIRVNEFLSEDMKISKELMCTISSDPLGTCKGDSGGPLVIYDRDTDRDIQIGAVYGSLTQCSDEEHPSVYARIDDFDILSFIRETAFGEDVESPYGSQGARQSVCKSEEFRCQSGECIIKGCSGPCIPKNWMNDGEKDCADGSDERPSSLSKPATKTAIRVRLGGSSKPNEGYVEALGSNGTWGGVCDDWWGTKIGKDLRENICTGHGCYGIKNAQVVCRMLGYSSAEAWFKGPGSSRNLHNFGNNPSGSSYVLDDLRCTGAESSIFDCPNKGGEWVSNCYTYEIAGVRCAT